MKRLFVLLLFVTSPTFAITGCGEPDYSDIPEVDAAEFRAKQEAEIAKGIEEEMAKQMGGGKAK